MSEELPNPDPPTSTATPATLDPDKQQYLQYLAIGHYIMAALAFVFGSIPILQILAGFLMATDVLGSAVYDIPRVGLAAGIVFMLIGLIYVLATWIYGFFMIKAANALKEQRNHVLCVVMAAVSCMFAPVGTVLGILTLLLLLNNDVKAAFDR